MRLRAQCLASDDYVNNSLKFQNDVQNISKMYSQRKKHTTKPVEFSFD